MVPRCKFISKRTAGVVFAVAAVLLLGCARKLQIELPAGFHGHIEIVCGGLILDHISTIHVDKDGVITSNTCPERQMDVVVLRKGETTPVNTSVVWTMTGDGLVRAIRFDVQ